ncbi:MAG: TPM domain-containing protein [Clostridia bacterium]|nr:TPM domain-containing protein [Clostridia bacterium]
MRKKIISILFILVILMAGNMSYAYNRTSYNTNKYNTYSESYNTSSSYNTTTSTAITQTNGEYQLIIEDDANLLTGSQKELLEQEMAKLTEYGNIIFKSINTNTTTAANFAKSYYNNRFGRQSGTVFLIDMKNRKIYIFSNGENYNKITDSKAETITDNIYEYATDKKYYECASEAYKQILIVLEGGKIAEPMKYISNGVLAVMVALFINFAIFKIATSNKKASGNEQIKECESYFEHTTPVVQRTGSHRVYSPQSSSSGGGGRRRRRRPEAEVVAEATASKIK